MSLAAAVQIADDEVYRYALHTLNEARLPFMLGGAFAFAVYTGIVRDTKDLDLFIRREDWPRFVEALEPAGFRMELTFPYWLGKAYRGDNFVDLIFSAANQVWQVDERWFQRARPATLMGEAIRLVAPEEMIWSKIFIMERERYDGADVAHLIRAEAPRLDWAHLINLVGDHWRVLLSHLILYGFIYPGRQNDIPQEIMDKLMQRLTEEENEGKVELCRGTLLSRLQYQWDLHDAGMHDARVAPFGTMKPQDAAHWTKMGLAHERALKETGIH